jgi:hypothetical protein
MFKQCVKLTELDLSNWKITHSNMDVTIDSMFQECVSLKNIKGLNSLFGTFDDVLNRVEGKYNPKYFSMEGVVGLFKGCSNLLLGQNENNIASWARMAVKISTMKEMFQGC